MKANLLPFKAKTKLKNLAFTLSVSLKSKTENSIYASRKNMTATANYKYNKGEWRATSICSVISL